MKCLEISLVAFLGQSVKEVRPPATCAEKLVGRTSSGYPQMLLVMERLGYPDFLLASADELIDGQYADRPELRPILQAILTCAASFGEFTIQARKAYVSLLTRKRTFAAVQPTTRTRIDVGL